MEHRAQIDTDILESNKSYSGSDDVIVLSCLMAAYVSKTKKIDKLEMLHF